MFSHSTAVLESEMSNLREVNDTIKKHQSEKAELEKQVRDLTAEKQSLLEKAMDRERTLRNGEWDMKKLSNALDLYESRCNELVNINKALHNKVDLLHNSILATQNYPEKLGVIEKEYYKQLAEKNYLVEQMASLKAEQVALKHAKDEIHTQVQVLENKLNILTQENANLTMKVKEAETKTQCIEFDNYRLLQQLEMLNVSKKTNETDPKIKDLESELQEKDKQKQELMMMVEQNTEVIKSLQNSCEEKDSLIGNIQVQYNELSTLYENGKQEIISMKQQILQLEANLIAVQSSSKNALDSLRKDSEDLEVSLIAAQQELEDRERQLAVQSETIDSIQNADLQLREQYARLQGLLKDHENIVLQRDKLIENQKEFLIEIENLHQNLKKKQKKCDSLTRVCSEQAFEMKTLGEQLHVAQTNLNESSNKYDDNKRLEADLKHATARLAHYEETLVLLEHEVDGYKLAAEQATEKSQLKTSELQSTIRELHETCRKDEENLKHVLKDMQVMDNTEKELKIALSGEIRKRKVVENKMETVTRNQQALLAEIETLKDHVNEANANCSELQNEYCLCQDEMLKRESEFVRTIQEQNDELKSRVKQIKDITELKEQLKKDVDSMHNAMTVIEDRNKMLEARVAAHGKTLHELAQVKRKSETLETQVHYLSVESDKAKTIGALLERQNSEVAVALSNTRRELEEARLALNSLERLDLEKIESIKATHSTEREQLLQEIKEMESSKIHIEQSAIEITKVKQLLEKEQQDLSDKLLKAVRLVLEERLKHQKAECRVRELSAVIMQLETDKATKEDQVRTLTSEVEDLREQLHDMNVDNEEIQEQVKRFEDSDLHMQHQSSTLQLLIDDLHKKLLRTQKKNQKDTEKMEDLILVKETTIMDNKKQIFSFEEKVERLTKTLNETRDKLLNQREEQSKLEKEIINLQAEKRDLNLRLHGVEGHLQEEVQLRQQLQHTSQKLLNEVSKMRLGNLLSREELLGIVNNASPSTSCRHSSEATNL